MTTRAPISLEIDQGDDEVLLVNVKDSEGEPANITGCLLTFRIRTSAAVDPLITKETADGITHTNDAEGAASISISAEDTEVLAAQYLGRSLKWELDVLDTMMKVTTLARGTIVINRDLA